MQPNYPTPRVLIKKMKKKPLTKLYNQNNGAARKSYLQELETHYQGLCIVRVAFTTYQIESLYIEANELPLSLRRYKLTLQYYTKLISCLQNPAYNCTMEIRFSYLVWK